MWSRPSKPRCVAGDDAEPAQGNRAAGPPRDPRHPTRERRRDLVDRAPEAVRHGARGSRHDCTRRARPPRPPHGPACAPFTDRPCHAERASSSPPRRRRRPPRRRAGLRRPFSSSSRDGEIRTRDFSLPKRARYQAAPRPVRHSVGTPVRWRRSRRASAGRGHPRPGSTRCRSSPTGPRRARSACPRAHPARACRSALGRSRRSPRPGRCRRGGRGRGSAPGGPARDPRRGRSCRSRRRRLRRSSARRRAVELAAGRASRSTTSSSSSGLKRGIEIRGDPDAPCGCGRERRRRRGTGIVADDDRRLVVANPLDEEREHRGGIAVSLSAGSRGGHPSRHGAPGAAARIRARIASRPLTRLPPLAERLAAATPAGRERCPTRRAGPAGSA